MKIFEEYLSNMETESHRMRFREVLQWVERNFPNLEPKLAWNQPMFTDHKTFIIGFSVSQKHFAVSPEAKGIDKFSDEIARAGYSRGKNIFRIKWGDSVDYLLLGRMIQYNIEDKKECSSFWRKEEQ